MAAMVHVALGIHDPKGDFSCHAGAMLASLFFGGSGPVCAHVVHDETLTAANQRNLSAIAQRFQKELRLPGQFAGRISRTQRPRDQRGVVSAVAAGVAGYSPSDLSGLRYCGYFGHSAIVEH